MQITLNRKLITTIVTMANAVVPRKCSLPVLEHLLIDVKSSDELEVTATDLEQTFVMKVKPLNAQGQFDFLIRLDELKRLKKTLKAGDTVTIEPCGDDELTLTANTAAGEMSWMIGTMPVDEFPSEPEASGLSEYDINAFLDAYRCAASSASTDETRGALTGVCADAEEGVLVGTDGRRLTKVPLNDFPLDGTAILPVNKMLMKRLPEAEHGAIGMIKDEHEGILVICADEYRFFCKCMPGTYPNYRQVIPGDVKDFRKRLCFAETDRVTLDALAPYISSDSNHQMFLRGNGDAVAVGIESEDSGPCAMALSGCRFEGDESVDVTVNCAMLRDALDNGFSDMQIRDRFTPLYFTREDGSLHLIMPLRTEPSEALSREFDAIVGEVSEAEPENGKTPEPEVESSPDEAEAPKPEPKEKPNMPDSEKQSRKPDGKDLKVVGGEDPMARLEELAKDSQEAVKAAQDSVRELKKQVRAVKTHYRDKEKDLKTREKEMEKNLTLINKLQESIAA